jgi:hypothetical protein
MMSIASSNRSLTTSSASTSSAAVNTGSSSRHVFLVVLIAMISSNAFLTPVEALVPLRRSKQSSTLIRPIQYHDVSTSITTKLNNRFQDNNEDDTEDESSSSYLSKRQRLHHGFQRDM